MGTGTCFVSFIASRSLFCSLLKIKKVCIFLCYYLNISLSTFSLKPPSLHKFVFPCGQRRADWQFFHSGGKMVFTKLSGLCDYETPISLTFSSTVISESLERSLHLLFTGLKPEKEVHWVERMHMF